jgi:hypothetical protein
MIPLVGWAPPTNTYRLGDSGHNHQGMNSLADSGSLRSQTGEFDNQSSSKDFCFEPRTSRPRLRANLTALRYSLLSIVQGA